MESIPRDPVKGLNVIRYISPGSYRSVNPSFSSTTVYGLSERNLQRAQHIINREFLSTPVPLNLRGSFSPSKKSWLKGKRTFFLFLSFGVSSRLVPAPFFRFWRGTYTPGLMISLQSPNLLPPLLGPIFRGWADRGVERSSPRPLVWHGYGTATTLGFMNEKKKGRGYFFPHFLL